MYVLIYKAIVPHLPIKKINFTHLRGVLCLGLRSHLHPPGLADSHTHPHRLGQHSSQTTPQPASTTVQSLRNC